MIRLETESRKLQALLGGAITTTALDVVVCFADKSLRDGRQFPVPVKLSTLSSGTAVDICDAPGPAVERQIDFISIVNLDSVSATVTVRYNDNGTTRNIMVAILISGESICYSHGEWAIMDSSGNRRG